MPTLHQINLQRHFGGGEVYTRFLSAALVAAGWTVELYAHAEAAFWDQLALPGVRVVRVQSLAEAWERLPAGQALVLTHQALGKAEAAQWAARHLLTGMLHMPLYERNPAGLAYYRRLFCVSRHVLDSARVRHLGNAWPEPLYGIADLVRGGVADLARGGVADLAPGGATVVERGAGADPSSISRQSVHDWDRRKLRDRVLGAAAPIFRPLLRPLRSTVFKRRPGLTLGIVSRLTPIKQFPLLFSLIAPALAARADVNLEIFGSGGYASVRDLRRALQPLGARARWWGGQRDVRSVYAQLDYVLSGLPEKEALGLNLIEAQACGTPVLAVNAPPFTETVQDGASGYLYTDPRMDRGRGFGELLARLPSGSARPDPRQAAREHLRRFSPEAFAQRLTAALADLTPQA